MDRCYDHSMLLWMILVLEGVPSEPPWFCNKNQFQKIKKNETLIYGIDN